MSLLQIGSFRIRGQGNHGVFYERTGHRVNLLGTSSARRACVDTSQGCIDSHEDRYRIYIRGNGALSVAQATKALIEQQLCPETGQAYFRRRETEDALLEIFRVRSGKLEHTDFRFQFTHCRTIALDATFELEPIPAGELTDVVTNDWVVTP